MADRWREIWGRREAVLERPDLATLLKLDGFDTGAGVIGEEVWPKYVDWLSEKIGMQGEDSVFEIGCGAGALLYQLNNGRRQLAGWDYGSTLISTARLALPDGEFEVKLAGDLAELEQQYDFVLGNSVFQYFPNEAYAETVVGYMVSRAEKAVGIFDVYDARQRTKMEDSKRRALGEEEYEKRYDGLRHAYYDRDWFGDLAGRVGWQIEVFDQFPGLAEVSNFRFNVIIRKG